MVTCPMNKSEKISVSFVQNICIQPNHATTNVDATHFLTPDTDKKPHLYYRIDTLSPGNCTMGTEVQSVLWK